jgi:hypothetical protein
MTKTFTSDLEFTAKQTEKDQENPSFQVAEPSFQTIENILNFSKNLEVKKSRLVKNFEYLRS